MEKNMNKHKRGTVKKWKLCNRCVKKKIAGFEGKASWTTASKNDIHGVNKSIITKSRN